MPDIRIKDLPETLDVESDDYVAVDNAGDGTRKYTLRQLIASVGVPEFVVNVSASGEADKTLSEITSAIASGYVPVAAYNDEYYQLTKTTETSATFTKYNELGKMVSVTVGEDFVLVEETPLTTDNITNHSGVTGENVSYALDELSYNISSLSDRVNDTVNSVSGMRDDIVALDSRVTDLEASSGGGSGDGLTQTEKNLILALFAKAVYPEDDANNYYAQLESLWDTSDKTLTYNLTHCIIDNPISTIAYGNRYVRVIGVQQGYSLNSVTVTMGGIDVTNNVYSRGTITIPSVTGDVVITATAVLAAQSITATYTQSGTVYDTDSLDSLKNDLVVTANYSGGTSDTITDYTLSGTLAEGTRTITVTYAGLTDTFDVVVSSATKLFNLASLTSTIDGNEEVDTNLNLREYDNISIMLTIDTLSAFNWNSQVLFSDGGTTIACLQLKINGNGNVDFIFAGTSKTLNPTVVGIMSSTGQKKAPLVFTFEGMNTNTPYVTVYGYINKEVVATERWSKNLQSLPTVGTKLYFAPDMAHSYNIAQRFQGTLTDIRVLGKIVSADEIAVYCEGE